MTTKKDEAFDDELFEARLEALKDTQEGVQQMSAWCIANRQYHKKIVSSWLSVFKRTRVEQRLVLFYLANDVIQNSKRKKYEFVESWATALQRATTMVRDEKVKSKILRIFKIWGDRDIYNEEYLADLKGLLNINPPKKSVDLNELSSDEFSNVKIVSCIRECVQNAEATDKSLKKMPKLPHSDAEALKQQLKDKSHTEDVEKELDRYITYMKLYYKNLQTELKTRKTLINEIGKARKFYHNQFGEVKVVAAAYKNFGLRIKNLQKKLNEITPNLPSPIPSPDINAPSPEPDADLQLPDEQPISANFFKDTMNGFSSYLDGNLPFDINDFKDENVSTPSKTSSQPIEVIGARSDDENYGLPGNVDYYKPSPINSFTTGSNVAIPGLNNSIPSIGQSLQSEYTSLARSASQYGNPLPPPPNAPLFDRNTYTTIMTAYSSDGYANSNINSNNSAMMQNPPHAPPPPLPPAPLSAPPNQPNWNLPWPTLGATPNTPSSGAYDPNHSGMETPVSPPRFEREPSLSVPTAPIEYTEQNDLLSQTTDVDHRQLHLAAFTVGAKLGLSTEKTRQLNDIDHRNLISLTGSPQTNDGVKNKWPLDTITGDIDYRTRVGQAIKTIETIPMQNISTESSVENSPTPSPLKPPDSNAMPPPSFPIKNLSSPGRSSGASSSSESQKDTTAMRYDPADMVIDMDMSDEDLDDILREVESQQHQTDDNNDYLHMLSSTSKAPEDTDTSDLLAQLQSSDEHIVNNNHNKPALLETPSEYNMLPTHIWDPTTSMNMSGFGGAPPPPLPPPRMPYSPAQQQFQPYIRPGGRGYSPHGMQSPYRPRHARGGGYHNGGNGRGGHGNPFFSRGGGGHRGRRGNNWI